MKPVLCNDVDRVDGKPLFTVMVYDIDAPVNFHSYDCLFFEQGDDLEKLKQKAQDFIDREEKADHDCNTHRQRNA